MHNSKSKSKWQNRQLVMREESKREAAEPTEREKRERESEREFSWWESTVGVNLVEHRERCHSHVRPNPVSLSYRENERHTEKEWMEKVRAEKSYWRGRLSTVDLLVLSRSDQLIFTLKILFTFFYKASYLNEEVICTVLAPSVGIPWFVWQNSSEYTQANVNC